MHTLLETGKNLRSQLASLGVASNARPTVAVKTTNSEIFRMFVAEKDVLQSLIRAGELIILNEQQTEPEGCLSGFVSEEITSYVKVAGLIDIDLELARIQKRSSQLTDLLDKLTKKMAAASYIERVPEKVRQQDSEKVTGYENELATLAIQTASLTKFK